MNSVKKRVVITDEMIHRINIYITGGLAGCLVVITVPFLAYNLWRSF